MNLEQQKKQARDLLRAIRSGNADAFSRLRRHHARWAAVDEGAVRQLVSLHDAQFVLAREQGFASWPKLKAYAEPSSRSNHTRLFVADVAWITDRVHGLLRTRSSAGPAALEQIREWHPQFSDRSDEEIRQAPFTEEDARLVYAREHGFETWDDLITRVSHLASNPAAATSEPFMAAFAALQSAEAAGFKALLRSNSRLAGERGTNGNTLLNLAVSFASRPDWKGGLSPIEAVLAAGSDVNEGNDRGWTPLHAAAYANQPEIAALLIEKGAALDAEAHGAGGTPLIASLFWGHREVADLLGPPFGGSKQPSRCCRARHPRFGGCLLPSRWQTHSRSLRRQRLLPPAQRFSGLATFDRSAGGSRRSTCVGLQEQSLAGVGAARESGRAFERRSVSRDAADLGCGVQPCGNRRMAIGSRREHQSEGHVWRAHARAGNHSSPPGCPERTYASG